MAKSCKRCATCKKRLSKTNFYQDSRAKDGLYSHCKRCHNHKYTKGWQSNNAGRVKKYAHDYTQAHPEQNRAKAKRYRQTHKQEVTIRQKCWQEANKDYCAFQAAFYREENQKRLSVASKAWRQLHKERMAFLMRQWRKSNHSVIAAYTANARAHKRHAKPNWVNLTDLKTIYTKCKEISKQTGILHHVDHIIPLTNPLVCGLHVPWNLQIISATLNQKKYNTIPVEVF